MVAHNRIAADIDCEDRSELLELFAKPVFAVFIIVAGEGIDAAEKCPADTTGDTVIDAHLVAGHDLMARISWNDRRASRGGSGICAQ